MSPLLLNFMAPSSVEGRSFYETVNKMLNEHRTGLSFYLTILLGVIDKGKEKLLQLFFGYH